MGRSIGKEICRSSRVLEVGHKKGKGMKTERENIRAESESQPG